MNKEVDENWEDRN